MIYSGNQTPIIPNSNQMADHDKHYDQKYLSMDLGGNLSGVNSKKLLRNESSEVATGRFGRKKYRVKKFRKNKELKINNIYGCPPQFRHRTLNSDLPAHILINLKYSPKNSTSQGNCIYIYIYMFIYIYIANNNSIKFRRDVSRSVSPNLRSPHSDNTKISLKRSIDMKIHSNKVGMQYIYIMYIYRSLVI